MGCTDCFLGLDMGSTSIKIALLSPTGDILHTLYARHNGRPLKMAGGMLEALLNDKSWNIRHMATTGVAAQQLGQELGASHVNEVVALSRAARKLYPDLRTVIEVGGQDAKIIDLSTATGGGGGAGAGACADDGADAGGESATVAEAAAGAAPAGGASQAAFKTFAMNSECAAGTGSFLDQQANRLGVSIEQEFGRLALQSEKPPRVAGRCSVFAKSDMIHLQQQAVPDFDIIAGLCFGMARNFKATLARGRQLAVPVALVGGVAGNAGMVRAFREVFGLSDLELRVPEHHALLPAIGAALSLLEPSATASRADAGQGIGIDRAALERLAGQQAEPVEHLEPLAEPQGYMPSVLAELPSGGGERVGAYLGIDVGSISTNLVLLDEQGSLLDKSYLMTTGRPIEAVRTGLRQLGEKWSERVLILGAATTGSGRYLTGDIVGADAVRNEITCQARGAAHVDPQVDTILEIGGQDSKYIRLRDGVVVDFEMNHVCAAGTGSFLEEQAERLGISIKEEFARLALSSHRPIRLGERCTVFMESDLQHHQQQGAEVADLVAGLSYSIAANYLNRVVGTRTIGRRILFQGGTAFNRAVTAAFAALTGREVIVPPHHEVTGAIGAALVARDARNQQGFQQSKFRGFELADRPYKVRSFTCNACANACDIREVRIGSDAPLHYGSRCDRFDRKESLADQPSQGWPDLFGERERLLLGLPTDAELALLRKSLTSRAPGGAASRGVVGVPRALSFHQLMPFFRTLLEQLNFEVLLSPATEAAIVHSGVESVTSQTCFPVKVAHGHARWLIDQGVDYLFLPSVLALPRDHQSQRYNHLCPYVQSLPYQIRSALSPEQSGVKLLAPVVDFEEGYASVLKSLSEWASELGITRGELADALDRAVAAQNEFDLACAERGRQLLANPPAGARLAVIVSRPYNGCDSGISLDLPRRMREAGLLAVPMDMLDMRQIDLGGDWSDMFWKYGQRILHAARLIAGRDDLLAVYLSNFGCGPDSFLRRFFQEIMGQKPFLALEVDEHSAAAGLITRLEAFVDSAGNSHGDGRRVDWSAGGSGEASASGNGNGAGGRPGLAGRTLMVPKMCDHAYAFAAAFRGSGIDARIIEDSDEESLALGRRHTSGKECLPCIVTAGDMLRELQRPGADPSRLAFFMPSGTGPCRFGLYNRLHQVILRDAGYGDVPVVSPNQGDSFYDDFKRLPRDPTRPAWQGIVAVDVLTQALLSTRPYEAVAGETDEVYQQCLRAVEAALENADSLNQAMIWCANQFRKIERRQVSPLARVVLVGEIYVRNHAFSNQGIVRRLEQFGLEVEVASFAEWIYYTNWTRLRRTSGRRQYRRWLGTRVKEHVQRADERRVKAPFADLLPRLLEAPTAEVVALGHPYIHDTFEGEAVLSVGKAVEAVHHGAAGVVNVMPFTCMPGNIVSGILQRVSDDLGALPTLSVAFDGQRDSTLHIRLEAFAEQVKSFAVPSPAAV